MTEKYTFDVEVSVDSAVDKEQARKALEAMLTDLEQAAEYHDVLVIDDVAVRDKSTLELLEMLESLDGETIEQAMGTVEVIEDE